MRSGSRWRRPGGRAAWPDGPRRRRARRTRWRRWAAAVLAALSVLVTVAALRPAPAGGAGAPTVVMARDVAAGQTIAADDVTVAVRPGGQRPVTALSTVQTAVGRVAAAPLAVHEVVTPERLVGGDLLAGQPGDHVALSVPVLDAASVGVRPGDHVDLYATGSGTRAATDVVVLAVRAAEASTGLVSGAPARLTLALDPTQAAEVARGLSALEAGQGLVVAVRHGPGPAQ
ncbi:SAF domain-containing protein [Terracoccus sp. 273MFTsu3.1]|uniref:SAF domain-containing protein n=1 Tax=Terracoccus sp. 273MFTsu3.1 TaxID=1172188 RepID=UPI0018CBB06B|nr:SAF domain-containing protein [Terracoccus sp. 273MFTsu3.1]